MAQKTITIKAIMTTPRYEAVWARSMIERTLNQCRIPLAISGGVFYGQCMQRALSECVDEGIDFVLTVDFDSIFTRQHVERLLGYAVHTPDIHAIAAVQPKRGEGTLLASNGVEQKVDWTGNPIKVQTAHFGLTVINVERLKQVEKPYFFAKPDEKGEWSDSRIDDDVWFWKQWEKAGNNLYVDPGCRLGHMEEMVTIFDENMQLKHIYPKDWEAYSASSVG